MDPRWEKQSNVWAQVAYYTGLGFILPGGLMAGYAIGWGLDRWLRTSPGLTVALAVTLSATLIIGIYPQPFIVWAQQAVQPFFS